MPAKVTRWWPVLLALGTTIVPAATGAPAVRPNIVVILTDDQRFDALGATAP